MIDSIFAGLADDYFYYDTYLLVRYILFLSIMNFASGYYSFRAVKERKIYQLLRFGWKGWYRAVLGKSIGMTIVIAAVGFVISYGSYPTRETITAFLVFLPNIILFAGVQAAVILSKNQALTGYTLISVLQLVSLFFSRNLNGAWKLLLPGNWGCINRSNLIVENGFPFFAALLLEGIGILILWLSGWRWVRYQNRNNR
ncbi:MAG: hypothetical protein Q4F21_12505 [Lachnospiraceae bacterium]|nr:hypothetical protein [Lachnospiraceae bacterium]